MYESNFILGQLDPQLVPVELVFRSNILALEAAIRDYRVQIGGLIIILDLKGVKLAHFKYLTPHLAKKTVEVVQEVFPLRFKAFHVLNEPFYFNAVLTVLKPFIKKEKLRHRVGHEIILSFFLQIKKLLFYSQIFTHGSKLESLHKFIPKNLLPIEYGGVLNIFNNSDWCRSILKDADYYNNLETELLQLYLKRAAT